MLLLQSLELQSSAVRRSIKIPSYSERAVPFPRSSQTQKRGKCQRPKRRFNIRGGDSPEDKQNVGPAFRAVRVGCGCSRQHITPPAAAAAAARSGCAPHTTVSAALFIQRWRPSCSRRGRAQLSYNSSTSTQSVRPPLSLKFISYAPGEEVN